VQERTISSLPLLSSSPSICLCRRRHAVAGGVVRGQEQRGGRGAAVGGRVGLRRRRSRLRSDPGRRTLLRPFQRAEYGVVRFQ